MKHGSKTTAVAAGISLLAMLGSTAVPTAAGASSVTNLPLPNDKPSWTKQFNEIGKEVAKLDGGTGWTAQPYSNTTAFQAVIRAAATTSKSPPVFTWWSGEQLTPLVQAGALANLTPEVKTWEAKYHLNPDVANAYKINGQYYGAPMYQADWVMFYNKKDFAENHIGIPTTWAQMMSDAAKLKAKGITPFSMFDDDWAGFIWFEQILLEQNPAAYEALVNGKISYTSKPVVTAMNEWKKIAELGYFSTPMDIDTQSSDPVQFVQGQQAMLLMGSWEEPALVAAGMKSGKDFGAFVVPPINAKAGWQGIFETGPFVVSAHSPDKQAALKAVSTFMEPKVQKAWAKLQPGFVSADTSVPSTDPTMKSVLAEIQKEHVHLSNRYWEATPPNIAVPVSSDLSQFILNPTLPLKPFLQKLQDVASSYWKSVKKK